MKGERSLDIQAYKKFIQEKLTRNFDFLDVEKFPLFKVVLFAEHKQSNEKFFFTKRVSLYSIENDEYIIMCEITKPLSIADIQHYGEQCKNYISKMLQISSNHMASVFTLVLVSSLQIPSEVVVAIKKVKFHKDFMFTLRGWADLALIVVDLEARQVYHNTFGKKMVQNYKWEES